MRFEHSASILRLYEPYYNNRNEGDPVLEDAEKLEPFGLEGLEQSFKVEELKGKKMTLSTDKLRIHVEKL